MAGELDRWVARLEAAAIATADASLRRGGTVPPVTVHVLSERFNPPYAVLLVCREFEPGADAAVALASMGALPAALKADRVVVCWEHVMMSTALGVPNDRGLPQGLVVLDASKATHEFRVHPLAVRAESCGTFTHEWGPTRRDVGGDLPNPIERLLRVWRSERSWSDDDVARVFTSFERAGYTMHWVRRKSRQVPHINSSSGT